MFELCPILMAKEHQQHLISFAELWNAAEYLNTSISFKSTLNGGKNDQINHVLISSLTSYASFACCIYIVFTWGKKG